MVSSTSWISGHRCHNMGGKKIEFSQRNAHRWLGDGRDGTAMLCLVPSLGRTKPQED